MISIDIWRKAHLAVAEAVDAWRIVPRLLVLGYSYAMFDIILWYKKLEPFMIEGCTSDIVTNCIAQAPTTQHAALVSVVIGASAAIFGLYTNSGRQWSTGVVNWIVKKEDSKTQ